MSFFKTTSVSPEQMNPVLESKSSAPIKQSGKLFKVFSRPNITIDDMCKISSVSEFISSQNLDDEIIEQTEIQIKYSGYIEKKKIMLTNYLRLEHLKIPNNFDYSKNQIYEL